MVMLAVRPLESYTTMGRETFLAKVTWENDWPVVNPGLGVLSNELNINLDEYETVEPKTSLPNVNKEYDFRKMTKFGPEWMGLRKSYDRFASFKESEGLFLKCGADNLTEEATPSYVCVRQDSHSFEAQCTFYTDNLYMGARAGIAYMQNDKFQLRFEITECKARVVLVHKGKEIVFTEEPVMDSPATLVLSVNGIKASCYVLTAQGLVPFVRNLDVSPLSTEIAGGFVGCTVGIFATDGEDREVPVEAHFKSFEYKRIVKEEKA